MRKKFSNRAYYLYNRSIPSSSEVLRRGTYKIEDKTDGTYLLIDSTVVYEGALNKGEKLVCSYKILSINEKEMELEDFIPRKFTMYRI